MNTFNRLQKLFATTALLSSVSAFAAEPRPLLLGGQIATNGTGFTAEFEAPISQALEEGKTEKGRPVQSIYFKPIFKLDAVFGSKSTIDLVSSLGCAYVLGANEPNTLESLKIGTHISQNELLGTEFESLRVTVLGLNQRIVAPNSTGGEIHLGYAHHFGNFKHLSNGLKAPAAGHEVYTDAAVMVGLGENIGVLKAGFGIRMISFNDDLYVQRQTDSNFNLSIDKIGGFNFGVFYVKAYSEIQGAKTKGVTTERIGVRVAL